MPSPVLNPPVSGQSPFLELNTVAETKGIHEAVLNGQVVILRGALKQLGLLKKLEDASFEGLTKASGPEVTERVRAAGFDRIHEIVDAEDIPKVTEAIYQVMKGNAAGFLKDFVQTVFGTTKAFYFEREPNVRFHIPYDLSAPKRQQYEQFARQRGQGKVTAHGPHRDSWLNCPDNAVNAWVAVGPVRPGNGMTFFFDGYGKPMAHSEKGEITLDVNPGRPVALDLEPGDMVLFHDDHLHGSELNRTDATRYVVSFRITFDKPHFPNGHFHTYVHSDWVEGPLQAWAEYPANAQWSFVSYRAQKMMRRLLRPVLKGKTAKPEKGLADQEPRTLKVVELPVGTIRAVSSHTCVARMEDGKVVAFSRRCPHQGADLANGSVQDGTIACPWHNLTFDPVTGQSPCSSLNALRVYPVEIKNEEIVVGAAAKADRAES
jgi:nitrite reductase/ring-hydroxylating ferredoxin subunit